MIISAYFTTRNCVQMEYPFEASIRSVFPFCEEVVVCDSSDGSDDTRERLESLKQEFEARHGDNIFKIVNNPKCDWNAPNSGIYDGLNKAYARAQCTGELCWQQDVDELASENTSKDWLLKIASKLMFAEPNLPSIGFPVVEPWGSNGKIRCDINPWKERLTINHPNITHGIPEMLKVVKEDGLVYAKPNTTDGCNLINKTNGYPISTTPIYDCFSPEVLKMNIEQQRFFQMLNLAKSNEPVHNEFNLLYVAWFNQLIDKVPFIWHYSWYDIGSKIKKYKLFWARSWDTLYGLEKVQPPGFPFFDKPWEDVTKEDIEEKAKFLEQETGGWIFHSPYTGDSRKHIELFTKKVPKPS